MRNVFNIRRVCDHNRNEQEKYAVVTCFEKFPWQNIIIIAQLYIVEIRLNQFGFDIP